MIPHIDIKCVLSIIESYSIEKMGPNFHICLRSGPTGLTVKYPFFMSSPKGAERECLCLNIPIGGDG